MIDNKLIVGLTEIVLNEVPEEFEPDTSKFYNVTVDGKAGVWNESELYEFIQESDLTLEKFKTVVGDQEFVWYDNTGEANPLPFTEITVNKPGPSCGCREFNFPNLPPTANLDYDITSE